MNEKHITWRVCSDLVGDLYNFKVCEVQFPIYVIVDAEGKMFERIGTTGRRSTWVEEEQGE